MKTLNRLGLWLTLVLFASSAQALTITPIITGADMAGIAVTASFNGSSETAVWAATSTDASVPSGEGFAGAAAGTGWSLSQQGFTLGNFLPGQGVLGVWTATNNTGFDITSLVIDASPGDIAFDQFFDSEFTPGSDIGRTFQSGTTSVASSAIYSVLISGPDLFGKLTINFPDGLASGSSFLFLADTDMVVVPLPGAGLLFGFSLIGLFVRRWRNPTRLAAA